MTALLEVLRVATKTNGGGGVHASPGLVHARESDAGLAIGAVPTIDLRDQVIEPSVLLLVSKLLCDRHTSIPVSRVGGFLIVAMADPGNPTTFEELAAHTGLTIEAVIAPEAAILEAIVKYYGA